MIIGISGKMQTGKDTVAKIIQSITNGDREDKIAEIVLNNWIGSESNWKIVKFADKLKDIVCLLTGCTREELEDNDFKNKNLPICWIRYGYADGFSHVYPRNGEKQTIMNNKQCDKERYEEELKINWQTTYKSHPTYREVLQYIGTDLFRKKLHEDTWVNATMADYKSTNKIVGDAIIINNKYIVPPGHGEHSGKTILSDRFEYDTKVPVYPNWIIPDVRFPNEVKAIEDRGGFVIRINRNRYTYCGQEYDWDTLNNVVFKDAGEKPTLKYANEHWLVKHEHPSEIALDYHPFKYVIDNNETIEELVTKVKEILIETKILSNV